MAITTEQKHLTKNEMINLGSYYTGPFLVSMVYDLLSSKISNINEFTILDSSCGYGSFLDNKKIIESRRIGADIDNTALNIAKNNIENLETVCHNSLMQVSRDAYGIKNIEKLIIVGNPPYNDTTSIIRNEIKSEVNHEVYYKYKTRDLGISFLRSYVNLNPEYVCVLHPLSYLIKKTNFNLLNDFSKNYKIIDSIIISSAEFSGTAPGKTYFPIVIALYKKDELGMSYGDIENFLFKTKDGQEFSVSGLTSIKNFISKYPNQKWVKEDVAVARFWTMRDINALKRSKTFVEDTTHNTIFIEKNNLAYYCYVDVFKQYINNIPYYFGNCDVFIDDNEFSKIKDCFVYLVAKKRPALKKYVSVDVQDNPEKKIETYFKNLLGKHYVDTR